MKRTASPRTHHAHRWPARYDGIVWIALKPFPAHTDAQHDLTLTWGPWLLTLNLSIPASGIVLMTGKAEDPSGEAATLNLDGTLPVFCLRGQARHLIRRRLSTSGGGGSTRTSRRERAVRDCGNLGEGRGRWIRRFRGREGGDGAPQGEVLDLPRRQRELLGRWFRPKENDASGKNGEASYSRRSTSVGVSISSS